MQTIGCCARLNIMILSGEMVTVEFCGITAVIFFLAGWLFHGISCSIAYHQGKIDGRIEEAAKEIEGDEISSHAR